jgi:hypothetical protein
MSSRDTLTPFISAPWIDPHGRLLAVRPLPGLRPEILRELRCSPLGAMAPDYQEFLTCCSGLANTALGRMDFTGRLYPEEECPVFNPCLTLAIDDEGRRWISELSIDGRPGRVWCLFAEPKVAVYVTDNLAEFLATLRDRTCYGRLFSWLQDLTAQAHVIWEHRRTLARRPPREVEADSEYAVWLATLPREAYVYDLRAPTAARGWPYGLAGSSGRFFRYRTLPVFAVAGPNLAGPRLGESDRTRSPNKGPRLEGKAIPWPDGKVEWAGRASVRARREGRVWLCA